MIPAALDLDFVDIITIIYSNYSLCEVKI